MNQIQKRLFWQRWLSVGLLLITLVSLWSAAPAARAQDDYWVVFTYSDVTCDTNGITFTQFVTINYPADLEVVVSRYFNDTYQYDFNYAVTAGTGGPYDTGTYTIDTSYAGLTIPYTVRDEVSLQAAGEEVATGTIDYSCADTGAEAFGVIGEAPADLIEGAVGALPAEEPAAAPYEGVTLRELAERKGFLIGTVFNTWTMDEDERVGPTAAQHFNLFAAENEAKMCMTRVEQDRYDFAGLDRLMEYAEANEMRFHGHVLVWHSCFPDWLAGQDLSRDEAIALLQDHIQTVVGRYKGRIAFWDVVNEAFNDDGTLRDTPWLQWIGDDYIDLAFQFAHETDPDALLFYNDYGAEATNAKSDAIYAMVSDMVARGIPINGVGLQMHVRVGDVGVGRPIDPADLAANIARLGDLGLQVQITEMDVAHQGELTEDIALRQAGTFYLVLQTCLQTPVCTGFTTWGLSDKNTWLRMPEYFDNPQVAPLLFDEEFQPKLAYTALLDVLARSLGDEPLLTDDEVVAMTTPPSVQEVELPEPTFSNADQLAPDSVNGLAYYAPFPVTITLDGDVQDWQNVPRDMANQVNRRAEGDTTSLTFAAAADDQYVYFLAEVQDPVVVYGLYDVATNWYQEDSPEFYINATGNLALATYEVGVAQMAIPAANIGNTGPALTAGGGSSMIPIQAVVVQTDTGYTVEAAVPLNVDGVWNIVPAQGGIIGFQAHLNGTSATSRDLKLIWSLADTQDQSWRDPSVFGRLIFWQVGQ